MGDGVRETLGRELKWGISGIREWGGKHGGDAPPAEGAEETTVVGSSEGRRQPSLTRGRAEERRVVGAICGSYLQERAGRWLQGQDG